ncbi:MAG: PqqD family protein [Bacteroidota bacterium]
MKIKSNIAVSDSGFIFNPDTGESYTVNPIGTRIIQMLKDGTSGGEINSKLLKEYSVDAGTLEKDIDDFTGLLRNYSLIENE